MVCELQISLYAHGCMYISHVSANQYNAFIYIKHVNRPFKYIIATNMDHLLLFTCVMVEDYRLTQLYYYYIAPLVCGFSGGMVIQHSQPLCL